MTDAEQAYMFLKAKVITMGGRITHPTKAGNFSVILKGCKYLLSQKELADACDKLPHIFGEVLAGKRRQYA